MDNLVGFVGMLIREARETRRRLPDTLLIGKNMEMGADKLLVTHVIPVSLESFLGAFGDPCVYLAFKMAGLSRRQIQHPITKFWLLLPG